MKNKQEIAREKLEYALRLFKNLEAKLKERGSINAENFTSLSEKERKLYLISNSYGKSLEVRDEYEIKNSCIRLYKLFGIAAWRYPALAERLKGKALTLYSDCVAASLKKAPKQNRQLTLAFGS